MQAAENTLIEVLLYSCSEVLGGRSLIKGKHLAWLRLILKRSPSHQVAATARNSFVMEKAASESMNGNLLSCGCRVETTDK